MNWYEIIIANLPGICTSIILIVSLINWVVKAVKEKNWGEVVKLVTSLMVEAEAMFDTGAERKEWVLKMVMASSKGINYTIDEKALASISDLIDNLCALSKKINIDSKEGEAVASKLTEPQANV